MENLEGPVGRAVAPEPGSASSAPMAAWKMLFPASPGDEINGKRTVMVFF